VSVLAVHHLHGPQKADLFRRVAAELAPGGRFVLADVVVPEGEGTDRVPGDPAPRSTPIEHEHDHPSSLAEQLRWLADAGLEPTVLWEVGDLTVVRADKRDP